MEHASNLETTIGFILFAAIAAGFVLSTYMIVAVLAPRSKSKAKLEPYECGEQIHGKPWVRIHVRYYIFAMLFLIFDVETVFLFPWAYYYKQLGLFGFIEMFIFLAILFLGLVFPWGKGVLTWDYSTKKLSKDKTL